MAGLSFIDVDLGKAAPLVGIAALGVAIWYVWNKSQQQAQANAAAQQASPLAMYQAAQDMALLQSLSGGTSSPSTTPVQSGTPQTNPLLPTYTAPGNPAQNYTLSASNGASLGVGSTTSNGL